MWVTLSVRVADEMRLEGYSGSGEMVAGRVGEGRHWWGRGEEFRRDSKRIIPHLFAFRDVIDE